LVTDSLKIIRINTGDFNKNNPFNKNPKIRFKNTKKNKIRIAYYSADFKKHAVSHLLANVLECHDKNDFEIFGYEGKPCSPESNVIMKNKLL
jgi:predicted O-linked N-acetylglucosamine transferase (SPINDLY family)